MCVCVYIYICMYHVWRDVVGVQVEGGPSKASIKDAVWLKHETRPNLDQRALLLVILQNLKHV